MSYSKQNLLFFQALNTTITPSGTDHFLPPAANRTLTKTGDDWSDIQFIFFWAEWQILKDEAQAKQGHSGEYTR